MPQYLCAFDMGTTSVKAGILTTEGKLIGRGYSEYPVLFPGPQRVEQSIDAMWKGQMPRVATTTAADGSEPARYCRHRRLLAACDLCARRQRREAADELHQLAG